MFLFQLCPAGRHSCIYLCLLLAHFPSSSFLIISSHQVYLLSQLSPKISTVLLLYFVVFICFLDSHLSFCQSMAFYEFSSQTTFALPLDVPQFCCLLSMFHMCQSKIHVITIRLWLQLGCDYNWAVITKPFSPTYPGTVATLIQVCFILSTFAIGFHLPTCQATDDVESDLLEAEAFVSMAMSAWRNGRLLQQTHDGRHTAGHWLFDAIVSKLTMWSILTVMKQIVQTINSILWATSCCQQQFENDGRRRSLLTKNSSSCSSPLTHFRVARFWWKVKLIPQQILLPATTNWHGELNYLATEVGYVCSDQQRRILGYEFFTGNRRVKGRNVFLT